MRRGRLVGLEILALALGLGMVSIVIVYDFGQQQQELLLRICIPGALLLALAIGASILWGLSLQSGPKEPEPFPWQFFAGTLDARSKQSNEQRLNKRRGKCAQKITPMATGPNFRSPP